MTKTDEERVDSMLALLNLTDLITVVSPTAPPYCVVDSSPVPKAGLPRYKWLTEANSCIPAGCLPVPPNSKSTGESPGSNLTH